MLDRLVFYCLQFLTPRSRVNFAWKLIVVCLIVVAGDATIDILTSGASAFSSRRHLIFGLGVAPFVALFMASVHHLVRVKNELHTHANTDMLTGLMNRRAFLDALEDAEEGAVMMIDVDHFKLVNDKYGHAAGDAVLTAIAGHLQTNLRAEDIIARVGGEEFAVYLVGADSTEIDRIGARVCAGFTLYNETVRAPIKVTMSIGAAYAAMAPTQNELFARADQALYEAKHSGRARLNFWQPVVSGRS